MPYQSIGTSDIGAETLQRQTLVTLLKVLESRQAGRDVADALKERQSLRRNRENLIKVRAPLMALQE